MSRFLAIVIGTLLISAAIYGAKKGMALVGYFFLGNIERKKEPAGFWVAIIIQMAMGITAELYGFGFL